MSRFFNNQPSFHRFHAPSFRDVYVIKSGMKWRWSRSRSRSDGANCVVIRRRSLKSILYVCLIAALLSTFTFEQCSVICQLQLIIGRTVITAHTHPTTDYQSSGFSNATVLRQQSVRPRKLYSRTLPTFFSSILIRLLNRLVSLK